MAFYEHAEDFFTAVRDEHGNETHDFFRGIYDAANQKLNPAEIISIAQLVCGGIDALDKSVCPVVNDLVAKL